MNLTIKSIPPTLHAKLVESANRHGRSLNAEVTHLLNRAFFPAHADEADLLADIRQVRDSLNFSTSLEEIAEARKEGRT
jgi:plasmid stability protein